MRPIDAEALEEKIENLITRFKALGRKQVAEDYNFVLTVLSTAPTIEVVPKELYEQILWERNIAMEQLEEHGIGFASKKE